MMNDEELQEYQLMCALYNKCNTVSGFQAGFLNGIPFFSLIVDGIGKSVTGGKENPYSDLVSFQVQVENSRTQHPIATWSGEISMYFLGICTAAAFAEDAEAADAGKKVLEEATEESLSEVAEEALKGSSETQAQYGDDFGKMGTYVENPEIKVDWTQYAEHGAERMQQRGMSQEMVDGIVENGKVLSQSNGNRFAYITEDGVAIISKDGKLITAWSSADFDSDMLEIIRKLFGK